MGLNVSNNSRFIIVPAKFENGTISIVDGGVVSKTFKTSIDLEFKSDATFRHLDVFCSSSIEAVFIGGYHKLLLYGNGTYDFVGYQGIPISRGLTGFTHRFGCTITHVNTYEVFANVPASGIVKVFVSISEHTCSIYVPSIDTHISVPTNSEIVKTITRTRGAGIILAVDNMDYLTGMCDVLLSGDDHVYKCLYTKEGLDVSFRP